MIKVEHGVSIKNGRPEFWRSWTQAQKEAWKAQTLNEFRREGIDLEKIVHDAVKDWRRRNPTRREMIEKCNLEAQLSEAFRGAMRDIKAEREAARPVTHGELSRELMRRGVGSMTKRATLPPPADDLTPAERLDLTRELRRRGLR